MVDQVFLKDPDVESLSSFIGIDGTNTTLNSGRISINLKPLDQRCDRAPAIIRRLQDRVSSVPGIALYLQPVQDITIETSVSRTQYQFVLQSPSLADLSTWVPRLTEKLNTLPDLQDVASDLQNEGRQVYLEIDRAEASRYGITTLDISNTLYSALGQRLISTIFTQSNQYRVVLEVQPQFRTDRTRSVISTSLRLAGQSVRLSSIAQISDSARDAGDWTSLSAASEREFPSTSSRAPHSARQSTRSSKLKQEHRAPGLDRDAFPRSRAGLRIGFAEPTPADPRGYRDNVHRTRRSVRKLHPPHHDFVDAAVGRSRRLLALIVARLDLGVIGIIGIILLIGIVKKNAIMMIDFAIDAESNQGLPPREAIYQACLLRFRPILMTTMAALARRAAADVRPRHGRRTCAVLSESRWWAD